MKRRRFGRWIAIVIATLLGLPAAYALIVWVEILPRLSEKDVANVELMRAGTQAISIDENAFFDVWMSDYDLDSSQFDEFARAEVERVDAAVLAGVEQVRLFNGPSDRRDGLNDAQTETLCPNDEPCLQHVAVARKDIEELLREKHRYLERVKTALSKLSLRIPFVARSSTPVPSSTVSKVVRTMQTVLAYQYASGERQSAIEGTCKFGQQLRAWRKNSNSLLLSMAVDRETQRAMELYIDMLRRTPIAELPQQPCDAWVALDHGEYRRCDVWRKEFEWTAATADVASSPSLRGKISARVIADWSTNKRHTEAKLAQPFTVLCNADVDLYLKGQRLMPEADLDDYTRCSRWEQIFNPTGCYLVDQSSGMTISRYFNSSFDLDAQLSLTRTMEARFLDAAETLSDPDLSRLGLSRPYPPRLSQILRAIEIPVHSGDTTWSLPIDRLPPIVGAQRE